MEDCIWYPE